MCAGRALTPCNGVQGEDGAVIGQLMITYEWSDWRASQIWWIQSVYVSEDRRRQGLFRSLYAHAKSESQKAGACGLRLYADNDNVKAQTTVSLPNSICLTLSMTRPWACPICF